MAIHPAIEPVLDNLKRVVECGDVAGLQTLVAAHPELRARLNDGLFAFGAPASMRAVQRKDLAMLDALIAAGASLDQRSHWEPGSFGVLDHADDAMAAQLIARGATVTIHAAAHLGNLARLRELLDVDPASVNARGGDGGTPLHFARNLEIAELLLRRGADVRIRDLDHGSTAAMWQVRNRDVLHRLVEAGSPIDIYMACVHGDLDLAARALREDPDCLSAYISHDRGQGKFAPDSGGNYYNWQIGHAARPIPTAARFSHDDLVRFLLERAKPVDRLIALCFIDDAGALRQLQQEHPAVTSNLDAGAARALPDAIHFGDLAAARRMVEAGFPVTGRGVAGGTPLHAAAWTGNTELVRLLIEKGASLEDRSNDYEGSPFEWACHGSLHGHSHGTADYAAVAEALLKAGATPPAVEENTASPAMLAVIRARERT